MRVAVIVMAGLLVTACVSERLPERTASLDLPPPMTIEEREVLGKQILKTLSGGTLQERVGHRVPNASASSVQGLELSLGSITLREGASPSRIYLQCRLPETPPLGDEGLVLDACLEVVREAVEAAMETP
jgi:hypothetical protein